MDILTTIIIGIGLSMDAFAASITNGITLRKYGLRTALISAFFFGFFQGLMPFIGWLFGNGFSNKIQSFDHWLAFVLLAFIGFHMIKEAMSENCNTDVGCSNFRIRVLLFMAVATSIDAMIAGVGMALSAPISAFQMLVNSLIIAFITFLFCSAGFYIGRIFGCMLKKRAEIAGGIILIAMGLKILLEHIILNK